MSYFGPIYADRELPHRARAVYMYLRDRADADGKCWPGLKTIAGDLKLSVATVQRALADLEKAGYVTINEQICDNAQNQAAKGSTLLRGMPIAPHL